MRRGLLAEKLLIFQKSVQPTHVWTKLHVVRLFRDFRGSHFRGLSARGCRIWVISLFLEIRDSEPSGLSSKSRITGISLPEVLRF